MVVNGHGTAECRLRGWTTAEPPREPGTPVLQVCTLTSRLETRLLGAKLGFVQGC